MKTIKAMKEYECYLCRAKINRGEQYTRNTIMSSKEELSGTEDLSESYCKILYYEMPVCNPCANQKEKKNEQD